MRNREIILNALKQSFPNKPIRLFYESSKRACDLYIDKTFAGSFDMNFLEDDFDKAEIEIKIKAPLKNVECFISNEWRNTYGIREAVEKGLDEYKSKKVRYKE